MIDFGYDLEKKMEKLQKPEDDQLYRHLKTFRTLTNNDDSIWRYRCPNGRDIEVYNDKTNEILFYLGHDPHLAEYICLLHNMSHKIIKEVKSKYDIAN